VPVDPDLDPIVPGFVDLLPGPEVDALPPLFLVLCQVDDDGGEVPAQEARGPRPSRYRSRRSRHRSRDVERPFPEPEVVPPEREEPPVTPSGATLQKISRRPFTQPGSVWQTPITSMRAHPDR
jgi:hypothetical protein